MVIYGDIDYDYCENLEDSVAYQESEVITEDSISAERGALDIFLPLKGTKSEMEQISSLLQRQGVYPVCYKKEMATEESVKTLSYQSPTWLHFGTHGFYSPEPLGGAENDDELSNQSTEEYVLSKSALVLLVLIIHCWRGILIVIVMDS